MKCEFHLREKEYWAVAKSSSEILLDNNDNNITKEVKEWKETLWALLQFLLFQAKARVDNPPVVKTKSQEQVYANISEKNNNQKQYKETSSATIKCLFCNKDSHQTSECTVTIEFTEKQKILRHNKICLKCGKLYHTGRQRFCRQVLTCQFCKKKGHMTSMCFTKYKPSGLALSTSVNSNGLVFLKTAPAYLKTGKSTILSRVFFDDGANRSFMSRKLFDKLNCPVMAYETLNIGVFGGSSKTQRVPTVSVTLYGTTSEFSKETQFVVIDQICEGLFPMPSEKLRHLALQMGVTIAESSSTISEEYGEIDLLIGSDVYWEFVTGRARPLIDKLHLVETHLGWVLQGRDIESAAQARSYYTRCMQVSVRDDSTTEYWHEFKEDLMIKSLWDTTDINDKDETDETLMRRFQTTLQYKNEEYTVSLLWKDKLDLVSNETNARNQVQSLIKRLSKLKLIVEYDEIIRNYLKEGIAEKVEEEGTEERPPIFYLPHHPVIRKQSSTTKIRSVLNASSGWQGKSLNANLHTGPNLLPDIVGLIVRFRLRKHAFTGDVQQAFLRLKIAPEDRDCLRFFWTKSCPKDGEDSKELHVFRMTKVPFGIKCSPFLLIATLIHHLKSLQKEFPNAVALLLKSIYMDDIVISFDEYDGWEFLLSEIIEIFRRASMMLQKWATSSEMLLKQNQEAFSEQKSPVKLLGLWWNLEEDKLEINLSNVIKPTILTKRKCFEKFASIFDPLGLCLPVTVKGKLAIQKLWKLQIEWDTVIPTEEQQFWKEFFDSLELLKKYSLPRYIFRNLLNAREHELHIFVDASTAAYGAVAYISSTDKNGHKDTQFLLAKNKLAPIEVTTLPRLELCAVLLGVRLYQAIGEFLDIKITHSYIWSDSAIAMWWIKRDPLDLQTYVSNRVREIQKVEVHNENISFKFVPGKDNPADHLTRGIQPEELRRADNWLKVPLWIYDKNQWPTFPSQQPPEGCLERRKVMATSIDVRIGEPKPILKVERFSSLIRVLRVTAWVIRFIRNLQGAQIEGHLQMSEIAAAQNYWISIVQSEAFPEINNQIRPGQIVPKKSLLYELQPFLDDKGILRARSRLTEAGANIESKPIILPSHHHFVDLVVQQTHERMLHGSIRDVMAEIRTHYWILRCRQCVRRVHARCRGCARFKAKPYIPARSSLPEDRVQPSPPFSTSGVDYCGPFFVRSGSTATKAYVVLFTCATTRAVHLELVTDMSCRHFLMAFRRFISRRGVVRKLYSDNAKTFVCGKTELNNIYDHVRNSQISDFCSTRGIEWQFIAERAPWWGGFWERMVRSLKSVLRITLGKQRLSFEELSTLLAEAEATINSRPLSHLSSQIEDPDPITPSHFLLGGYRLTSLPPQKKEDTTKSTPEELQRRWAKREQILNSLWKRWTKEYLCELRYFHSTSPGNKQRPPKEGDVVLIGDMNTKRLCWKMGRIIECQLSRGGIIRSCVIKLPDGSKIRRAVNHLYHLESDRVGQ